MLSILDQTLGITAVRNPIKIVIHVYATVMLTLLIHPAKLIIDTADSLSASAKLLLTERTSWWVKTIF